MKQEEFDFIKDAFSQILDDIAGNPDWSDAASAISADLGALERELEGKVVSPDKSLEEAAEEYIKKGRYFPEAWVVRPAFIAGAEWQAKKCDEETSKLLYAERQTAYINGWDDHKQQMLKDAIEGQLYGSDGDHWIESEIYENLKGKEGDKVRIVVLKDEEYG